MLSLETFSHSEDFLLLKLTCRYQGNEEQLFGIYVPPNWEYTSAATFYNDVIFAVAIKIVSCCYENAKIVVVEVF